MFHRAVRAAQLRMRVAPGGVTAVVLVFPGGKVKSHRRASGRQLAVLRMHPFARRIVRTSAPGIAVGTVRYRVRGWNGPEASPLSDGRWALAQVRQRYPGVPVVLVGHSMGARTVLRLIGDPDVVAVAALAPWLPPGEPVPDAAGRSLLFAHGARDSWTDPRATEALAETLRGTPGALVRFVLMDGAHAMLRHPARWHRLVAEFVHDSLGARASGSADTRGPVRATELAPVPTELASVPTETADLAAPADACAPGSARGGAADTGCLPGR